MGCYTRLDGGDYPKFYKISAWVPYCIWNRCRCLRCGIIFYSGKLPLEVFYPLLEVLRIPMYCVVVCLLGGEAIGIEWHLVHQCDIGGCQICDEQPIFHCRLRQVREGILYSEKVVVTTGVFSMEGGLLTFAQVGLWLNAAGLELRPCLVLLRLMHPAVAVLLKLDGLCDESVYDLDKLTLDDGITRRDWIVRALIEYRIEALKCLVQVEWFLEAYVIVRNVSIQNLVVILI